MQIRGLPGHVIRNAFRAARLLAAKTPDFEAARRRDAVARWQEARRHGLTAVYDLPHSLDELNPLIDAFQHRYNTYRPHRATPAQYLAARQAQEAAVSHLA